MEGMMRARTPNNSRICYVEIDPSGRFGRSKESENLSTYFCQFEEILGRGSTKTVYKAFDGVFGMEVAWSQVMLNDVLCSSDALPRLYMEVHLLKNLNHKSIIRIYKSWIDPDRGTFNFITEMLTSGTLREYRQKFKRVDIRAIKNWARQILQGIAHLHSLDPPVIHRDLKCDNIFVNGHLGEVKIGDFGLAAILRGSKHAHSLIGTPEFMAPEIYEEKYNELVDVYSFGMCILEMLTSEYPYSECSNSVKIYNKVKSGKKPRAFYRIQDVEARQFIAKCLEHASRRPPAHELLLDPFLAHDDDPFDDDLMSIPTTPLCIRSTKMTITGSVTFQNNTVSLKVQISAEDGLTRDVDFLFDIIKDTATDVAMEMVRELDITDWEPNEIADMIEEELSSLVPDWKALNSPKSLQHHSFNFDDDDDENHLPYMSFSPSHESLNDFSNPREEPLSNDPNSSHSSQDFHQGHSLNSEESLPESSNGTNSNSNIEYSSQQNELKSKEVSRFCPKMNTTIKCDEKHIGFSDTLKSLGSSGRKKLSTKFRYFMDIRTQLLRRRMQAVNNRRTAKTVAAVENIGFRDPI